MFEGEPGGSAELLLFVSNFAGMSEKPEPNVISVNVEVQREASVSTSVG